jgi:hypothetical protein
MNNVYELKNFKKKDASLQEPTHHLTSTILNLRKMSYVPGYGSMCLAIESVLDAIITTKPKELFECLNKCHFQSSFVIIKDPALRIGFIFRMMIDLELANYYLINAPKNYEEALHIPSVYTFHYYTADENDPVFVDQVTGELNKLNDIPFIVEDLVDNDYAWYQTANKLPLIVSETKTVGETDIKAWYVVSEIIMEFINAISEDFAYDLNKVTHYQDDNGSYFSKFIFTMGLEIIEVTTNYTEMSKMQL